MRTELELRLDYNRTVGEMGRLLQCSNQARSFIRNQITKNQHIVNELLVFGELTAMQSSGLTIADEEPADGGSRAATDNELGISPHSERQRLVRRRYIETP